MAEHYEVGDIVKLKKRIRAAAASGKFCVSAQISVSNAPAAATRSW